MALPQVIAAYPDLGSDSFGGWEAPSSSIGPVGQTNDRFKRKIYVELDLVLEMAKIIELYGDPLNHPSDRAVDDVLRQVEYIGSIK